MVTRRYRYVSRDEIEQVAFNHPGSSIVAGWANLTLTIGDDTFVTPPWYAPAPSSLERQRVAVSAAWDEGYQAGRADIRSARKHLTDNPYGPVNS
ncbi:MAG: hypothetical protein ACR2JO_07900 [Mycobacteriales bacterium]